MVDGVGEGGVGGHVEAVGVGRVLRVGGHADREAQRDLGAAGELDLVEAVDGEA